MKKYLFPVQLLVHFPEDVLLCPLYLEFFPEKKPLLKTVWRLHTVTPVPVEMVLEKVKAVR